MGLKWAGIVPEARSVHGVAYQGAVCCTSLFKGFARQNMLADWVRLRHGDGLQSAMVLWRCWLAYEWSEWREGINRRLSCCTSASHMRGSERSDALDVEWVAKAWAIWGY